MKNKRTPTGLIVTLLIIAVAVFLVRHFHIKNFKVIEPEVLYTSGQPRGMDYTRILYKYHIATIVNVRSAFEHREENWFNEEITWVRKNGVNYFELPIDRSYRRDEYFPNRRIQDKFLEIMSNKENLPVLVHGGSGKKRVAMLVSVWLRKIKDLSIEDTIKAVEKIKEQPVTEEEKQFIESL